LKILPDRARANSQTMSRPILYVAITNRLWTCTASWQRQFRSCVQKSADFGDNGTALVARVVHPRRFIYRPRAFDVGVVQADSLMDKAATLANCNKFVLGSDRSLPGSQLCPSKPRGVNPSRPLASAQSLLQPVFRMSRIFWLGLYLPRLGGEFVRLLIGSKIVSVSAIVYFVCPSTSR